MEKHDAQSRSELVDAALLACTGGILDAFTYVNHGHVFANSMTGNVVLLGINAIAGNGRQSWQHLLPIVSFFLGVSAAGTLGLPGMTSRLGSRGRAAVAIELVILTALSFLPSGAPDFPITISVAFAASIQMATFRTVEGNPYSSTFTTGNLRTLSENSFAWFFSGRQPAAGRRIRVFSTICSLFFVGAAIGAFLAPRLYNHTLWVVCLPLITLWFRLRQDSDHLSSSESSKPEPFSRTTV